MKRPEVKIVIPDVLKLQLVDGWENLTENNQVSSTLHPRDVVSPTLITTALNFTRKPPVRELLEEYRQYVVSTKTTQERLT
jgi:mortality factor 4-like protein 1